MMKAVKFGTGSWVASTRVRKKTGLYDLGGKGSLSQRRSWGWLGSVDKGAGRGGNPTARGDGGHRPHFNTEMLRNMVGGFYRNKRFQQSQLFALGPPKCPILTNLNLPEGQEGTWVRTDPILMLFLMKWGEKELKRGGFGLRGGLLCSDLHLRAAKPLLKPKEGGTEDDWWTSRPVKTRGLHQNIPPMGIYFPSRPLQSPPVPAQGDVQI